MYLSCHDAVSSEYGASNVSAVVDIRERPLLWLARTLVQTKNIGISIEVIKKIGAADATLMRLKFNGHRESEQHATAGVCIWGERTRPLKPTSSIPNLTTGCWTDDARFFMANNVVLVQESFGG